jgi:pyruvate carboxylase subunit B
MKLIVLRDGQESRVEVEHNGDGYTVNLEGQIFRIDSRATSGAVRSLIIGGRQFEVAVRHQDGGRYSVHHQGVIDEVEVLDPLTYLAEQGSASREKKGPQQVTAYMPGRVVAILVEEGAEVQAGQGLVVLEAMKMENEIQAQTAGVVRQVFVSSGQAVEGGDPLFEIDSGS